jgi:hypothetical protein
MADDRADRAEDFAGLESLINMKNVGLVVLPWLKYQQNVLDEARNVIDDEDHPVRHLFRRFATTAYGSQIGLQMALRDTRRGTFLLQLSELLTHAQMELAEIVQRRGKTLTAPARAFVDSYEELLGATIEEVERKTGKGKGSTGGQSGSSARARKQWAPSRRTTSRAKPRQTPKSS